MAAKKAAAARSGDSASKRSVGKQNASAAVQAGQALRESYEELQAIYDGMVDGLLIVEHETKGFLRVNSPICEMLGYSEEELLGMSVADIHPPDVLPRIFDQFVAMVEGRQLIAEDVPFQRKDGTVFFADVVVRAHAVTYRGRPCAIAFIRDVTRRKKADDALRRERDFSTTLLRTSPTFFVAISGTGRTLMMNEAMLAALGYAEDEVLGADYIETFVPEPDREPLALVFRKVIDSHEPTISENRVLTKDGRQLLVEWHGRPVFKSGGELEYFFGVGIDITERRRAEEELARYRGHLEELVEERTAKLADANRELRESKEELQNEQRLLRQLLNLHEKERKLVAYEIHDGLAQHLTGALLQFQSVGRLPEGCVPKASRGFDVGLRLLNDCINETRRLISGLRPPILDEEGIVAAIRYLISEHEKCGGPKIEFVHEFEVDRLAPVLETAIFRIVQETLTNACRYSQSKKVRVELVVRNGHIHVEVRDWGIGFDPSQIPEDHFGLQSIRERARLLGGQAVIDTSLDKGSQIMVELPLLERAPSQAESAPQ